MGDQLDDLLAQIQAEAMSFVDWPDFWADDNETSEWLYEPILARGRGHALYAGHKTGKSLAMLYIAAKLATGHDPVVAVYIDYEMTEEDLRERLEDMGYGPDSDLSRLRYALLPSIPPLDTADGAAVVLRTVDQTARDFPDHHILVVVDTMGRAVAGDENLADTVRAFYRETGIHLKKRGCTWVRLDHAGKDPDKGQRGSSAKGDDVDVVWSIEKNDGGVTFKRDVARMRWVPEKVAYRLNEEPLQFVQMNYAVPAGTAHLAGELERLGAPLDISRRSAHGLLITAGIRARNEVIAAALRYRKEKVQNGN